MKWLVALIPCTTPLAAQLGAILSIALLIQILILWRFSAKRLKRFLIVQAAVLVLILWLGSYRYSPLYARTRSLRGFDVTVLYRTKTRIQSGAIVTLGRTSLAAIVPVTVPGDTFSCNWSSEQGGALDDATSCEIIYAPPAADYDILRLSLRSSCGLPNAVGRVKFSILP